jgi:hypothetical protein
VNAGSRSDPPPVACLLSRRDPGGMQPSAGKKPMTIIRKLAAATALACALAACGDSGRQGAVWPASVAAPSAAAPPVADLVGVQATAGGATALAERGYVIARRQGMTARFWWHERSQQCLQVVTINGRFRAIDPAAPADCGR